MLIELREEVRRTALEMMTSGLVRGTDGNVSARDGATGYVAITPSSMPYDQIRAEDVVVVDLQGHVVCGTRRPSWETPMHTCLYRLRPDIGAVMHTHSYYATLLSLAGVDLPPTTMSLAGTFGGLVRCCPYVRTGSPEVATVAVEMLGEEGKAVLLGNHGTLAVARDLATALSYSKTLEEGAKLHYEAACLGVPPRPLPQEEVRWLYDLVHSSERQDGEGERQASRSHP